MKVCMNAIWAAAPPEGETKGKTFKRGQVADVTEEQGADLIKHGYATAVPVKVTAAEAEPEAVASPEEPKKRTKHGRSRGRDAAGD